jgi:hypothetical protein
MTQLSSFLHKSFRPFLSSIILPLNKIAYFLAKTAKSNSYIETLGDHADPLHLWIKRSYEDNFKAAFESQVRKAIKHLHISYARLAFDITAEPFYGRTRGVYIFDTPPDKKHGGEFRFITVCLITRNKEIPLMALPLSLGSQTRLVIGLMKYCQTLFKGIRLALFDRGFYNGELIDFLEARKIKYIILVPEKKGRIKGYVEETEELGKFRHQMRYSKKKSTWKPNTTIIVCKRIGVNKQGKSLDWIFASNIQFRTRVEYVYYYKRRWQIETNYRVEDEARIKSKSTNYLIRYFYFLISLLFHLLWIVNKNLKYYAPFKKYLDNIEQAMLRNYLEIDGV